MLAQQHNNKPNKKVSTFRFQQPLVFKNSSCLQALKLSKLEKKSTKPLGEANLNGARPSSVVRPSANRRVSFPRTLGKPMGRKVDAEQFYAQFPELKGVPLGYVRENFQHLSTQFYHSLQCTRIVLESTSQLPKELDVVMTEVLNFSGITPSHILALNSGSSKAKYTLYPIHSSVFAANCSKFPILPPAPAAPSSNRFKLPTVCITLPSPENFGFLSSYIYNKDVAMLRSLVLPNNWATDVTTVVRKAIDVRGLWANACALGVVEDELFNALEQIWDDVMQAMAQVSSLS